MKRCLPYLRPRPTAPPAHPPVDRDAGLDVPRRGHGRGRRLDARERADPDRRRPRRQPVGPAVDRRRLRADARRLAPAGRRARRPLRPPRRARSSGSRSSAVPPACRRFAGSSGQLIAYRAAMGIGAALIMPGTLSTITSIFPPEERAKAVGIWAGFAGAGGTLGILVVGRAARRLLLGLDRSSSSPASPPSLFAAVVLVVPRREATERVGLDPLGSVLSAVGIGALVLGIIEGPDAGWTDPLTLVALLGGVALLAAFVLAELRTARAAARPRLFSTAASPPARPRCSCSSSPCSGSSSCRCSSCSSCSATAPSRPRVALLPMAW